MRLSRCKCGRFYLINFFISSNYLCKRTNCLFYASYKIIIHFSSHAIVTFIAWLIARAKVSRRPNATSLYYRGAPLFNTTTLHSGGGVLWRVMAAVRPWLVAIDDPVTQLCINITYMHSFLSLILEYRTARYPAPIVVHNSKSNTSPGYRPALQTFLLYLCLKEVYFL